MLHKEAVSPNILELIRKLQSVEPLKNFRLVGGTALAFQLGHRTSEDIDLFTDRTIDKSAMELAVSENFPDAALGHKTGFGIIFQINNIKVDLCHDRGRFIRPEIIYEGIKMASLEDIAAMKTIVIAERAKKKDFYDIAVLLEKFSIREMVQFYRERYPFLDPRNLIECFKKHYLADEDKNLIVLKGIPWEKAKEKIDDGFAQYLHELKTAKQKQIEQRLKNAEQLIAKKKKL